ncbi:MAG: hypothetical protein Q7R48_00780 [bacterium]|nr:hypothetical protein [bacterium]
MDEKHLFVFTGAAVGRMRPQVPIHVVEANSWKEAADWTGGLVRNIQRARPYWMLHFGKELFRPVTWEEAQKFQVTYRNVPEACDRIYQKGSFVLFLDPDEEEALVLMYLVPSVFLSSAGLPREAVPLSA